MTQVNKVEENSEHLIASLKEEKDEIELSLSKEKQLTLQLKHELAEAETRNSDLYKVFAFAFLLGLSPADHMLNLIN